MTSDHQLCLKTESFSFLYNIKGIVLTCGPRVELLWAPALCRRSWEPWRSWSPTPSSLPSRRSSRFLSRAHLSSVNNNGRRAKIVHSWEEFLQFSNSEHCGEWGPGLNFCASTAQKFPHSQTYAQTAFLHLTNVCVWSTRLSYQLTNQWDGLAGLRHPLSDGQHEYREGQDHLDKKVFV